MKKYGLIGYPLAHSFSEEYFTEKFQREGLQNECSYEAFPLTNLSDFPAFIKANPNLCGLNVTIPHKIGIIYFLNKLAPAAKEIDAVNCIKITKRPAIDAFFMGECSPSDVFLEGYNTDAYGFEHSLRPLLRKHHQKALILGNGGASRAIAYVLQLLNIDHHFVSRKGKGKNYSYAQLSREIIEEHTLIINTTPLGTFPKVDESPEIPYKYLTKHHLLYDLVYNPEESTFLKQGKAGGATIKNGLEMLHLQAEKAWEIWNS
ncbi:MAG: shikimate dehydrogenase [Sphingobacteriaceae bacterium]|jgi:shikimate dehydrogenase|nr:MAG: shikimate dehydrogenase [Pedobacter sp.]